ncbi:type II toxin-antitoxin system RelE/ParE family toxin [Autumnicola edwardsiae]|uniref:Type II toxin-antitoxin system RelE/ParE family toxin n=1 Tax=Autumnicola edwardsiae TaxID=3075594 RepID=A0ABU3CUL8_9FLAO|nr:type II toxin-antitoxin system RelE/ParE family toxin [Zunongwangia sp. F297]MDT0650049.1 type II toxin-antitoxin system RelE/ParE family toxin [Zunongwangia sp. F297]
MSFKIRLFPRAEKEISEAVLWYENKQKGLSTVFIDKLDSTFRILKQNPHSFIRRNKFRQVQVEKSPYIIIYNIEENEIIIHSVFHTRQDPTKKP